MFVAMNGPEVDVGMSLLIANPRAKNSVAIRGTVDRVGKYGFVVRTQGSSCARGEVFEVTRPAHNARYQLSARVEATDVSHVVLMPLGPWVRVQQREFVRYRPSPRLPVEIHRVDPLGCASPEVIAGELVDLSAGGAQVELPEGVDGTRLLQVRFRLPSLGSVHACARVVRSVSSSTDESSDVAASRGVRLGMQFVDLGRAAEQTILHWIFRQQAAALRAHREE